MGNINIIFLLVSVVTLESHCITSNVQLSITLSVATFPIYSSARPDIIYPVLLSRMFPKPSLPNFSRGREPSISSNGTYCRQLVGLKCLPSLYFSKFFKTSTILNLSFLSNYQLPFVLIS